MTLSLARNDREDSNHSEPEKMSSGFESSERVNYLAEEN